MSARPRIAFYLRTSSDRQKVEDTIARQHQIIGSRIQGLLETRSLVPRFPRLSQDDPVNRFFIDDGFNLEVWDETTAFFDLMSRCKRSEIDQIFVSETDRLFRSRSSEIRGRIVDILVYHKITIVTQSGELSGGPLMLEILSAVGADDKRGIGRKLQQGKIKCAMENGRRTFGNDPFGFRYTRAMGWEVVPEEAMIVKCIAGLTVGRVLPEMPPAIAALAAANPGGVSDVETAQALNAAGFSKRPYYERTNHWKWLSKDPQAPFSRSFMEQILNKDRYRGEYTVYMKEADQVGRDDCRDLPPDQKRKIVLKIPRILPDDIWEEIRLRRAHRQFHAKRNVKHEYLAADLLVCAVCGIQLQGRPGYVTKTRKSDGTRQTYGPSLYYTCTRKQKVSGFRCSARKCHNAKTLDALIWSEAKRLIISPESVIALDDMNASIEPAPDVEALRKSLAKYEMRLMAMTKSRANLVAAMTDEIITREDFVIRRDALEAEQQGLKKLSSKLVRQIGALESRNAESPPVDISRLQALYGARLDQLAFEERRTITTAVVRKVVISPDGEFRITLRAIRCLAKSRSAGRADTEAKVNADQAGPTP